MAENIFLPDPDSEPRNKGSNTFRTVAIVLALVGGLSVLSCCGIGAVGYFRVKQQLEQLQEALADHPVVLPAPETETFEQRRTDVQAGFGAAQSDAAPAVLSAVNGYFDKLIEATRNNDEVRFRSLIDARRFMDEVKKRGVLTQLNQSDEVSMIKDFETNWLSIPVQWIRYRVASVRTLNSGRDAVAYVYFWDESQSTSEVRFWLTRSGSTWKGYDWETLEFGTRESLIAAAFTRYADQPISSEHMRAIGEIREAYQQFGDGKQEAAAKLLAQAEQRKSVPELADNLRVQLAYGWRNIGEPRNCLLTARKIRSPGLAAGALFAQAAVYEQYGLHRRALEFARQYDDAIGGGPACCELLADIYDSLGNSQAAIECRQKLLRFDPDNAGALTSLALAASEADRQLVVDLVRQTSEPVERAAGLVVQVASGGDPTVARALADYVIQTDPGSARAAAVEAHLAAAQEEHEQAAAFFKTAWERAADEQREHYVDLFLDSKASAGKPVEGYEQAPDATAAFRHFVSGGDEGDEAALPPDQLRALFEAHRLKHPDDPWLHYHGGRLFQQEQDYTAAEREFRAAIEHAEEDEDEPFREALLALLDDAGRCLEAYADVMPPDQAFRLLVQRRRWSQSACDLQELLKRHAAVHPDDPWLDSCAAMVQKVAGNIAEALRLATHGYEATDDESIKGHYRGQAIDLALEADDFAAVYKIISNPDEALRTLAQRARRGDARQRVQSVLQQHVKERPITPLWRMLQVEQQWNDRDYAGVISTIEPAVDAMLRKLPDWETARLANWYVRSLMHVGRNETAREFAELACDQCGQAIPLLYFHVHERNILEAERLLEEFGTDTWKINSVYNDPEAGEIIRSADFLPLRRAFPPDLMIPLSATGVVLLRDEPPAVTADFIQTAARSVLGDDCVVEPFEPPPGTPSPSISGRWLIRAGQSRLSLTAGSDRYFSDADPGFDKPKNQSLAEALARRRGWFSVRLLGPDGTEAADQLALPQICKLAARLRDDHCLAVQFSSDNRFVENTAELGAKLEADDPARELAAVGETLWLPRQRDPETAEPTRQETTRSLAKFAAAFQRDLLNKLLKSASCSAATTWPTC